MRRVNLHVSGVRLRRYHEPDAPGFKAAGDIAVGSILFRALFELPIATPPQTYACGKAAEFQMMRRCLRIAIEA